MEERPKRVHLSILALAKYVRKLQKERGIWEGVDIRMIYSFRPLPLMKACGWMTYRLTVHTIMIPMSKKTIKLTTMYLSRY